MLFGDCNYGLGKKELSLTTPFQGYRNIDHQSIDVGLRYILGFETGDKLLIEYARRLHAHSAPAKVESIAISYFFPFSPLI